ncbi:Fur family transcriptional regulator, ferric uptake regulator [Zhouia amylolytica]|uniref:Fur family transcriptional regulator, ferric uptake regulator n=1 Tax=Zhouia amylolytica TaxID=376730 RepID=A0A1I6QTP9_9FLAO|nr:transcriptional repressor [Zhouia amylolytica]MCQ0112093.1 transcriptional repressor [Zhouia amylolytica]SFS55825.1 Fur family transcriptional regulator, ferric uptake regulator [Zhouia amylolytica]
MNLENALNKHQIKPTSMRILVLKQLISSKSAMSLSDLEACFDRVDKTTLYRTLKTFEEKKLIHSIEDGTGSLKYAMCEENCNCEPQDQHIHFHCSVCEETFCFMKSKIPSTNIPSGFKVTSATMVYKGVCPNCES